MLSLVGFLYLRRTVGGVKMLFMGEIIPFIVLRIWS